MKRKYSYSELNDDHIYTDDTDENEFIKQNPKELKIDLKYYNQLPSSILKDAYLNFKGTQEEFQSKIGSTNEIKNVDNIDSIISIITPNSNYYKDTDFVIYWMIRQEYEAKTQSIRSLSETNSNDSNLGLNLSSDYDNSNSSNSSSSSSSSIII
jgi:hypothetical protein